MISLGIHDPETTHNLFQDVLHKLISLIVIANFLVFTATFLWCILLNRVRGAAKISAGGVGSPYNQLRHCYIILPSTQIGG